MNAFCFDSVLVRHALCLISFEAYVYFSINFYIQTEHYKILPVSYLSRLCRDSLLLVWDNQEV